MLLEPLAGVMDGFGSLYGCWELNLSLCKNKCSFFFFFFFFSELGTEPRALRLLGKRSSTELNPQPQNKCS